MSCKREDLTTERIIQVIEDLDEIGIEIIATELTLSENRESVVTKVYRITEELFLKFILKENKFKAFKT
jgi:hypothetical protein